MKAEHVFVDTNIFLRIFRKTSDTLNEVEVLLELIKAKKVVLYTTDQVVEEYYRNVEREIEEAIAEIRAIPDKVELPRIAQQFTDAAAILESFTAIRDAKKDLLAATEKAARDGALRADALVNEIFQEAKELSREEVIDKARLRRDLGNPPGKKDSLGDQINWECLLAGVKGGQDLSIISRDADFSVKIGSNAIKQYLNGEWEAQKDSNLVLYHDLKQFLADKFPEAKDAMTAKKSAAIEGLAKSGSFLTTHKQIAVLDEVYDSINAKEAVKIFEAMVDNTQVSWVASDEDVKDFYSKLFERYYLETPKEFDERLYTVAPYLNPEESSEEDEDDDIPF